MREEAAEGGKSRSRARHGGLVMTKTKKPSVSCACHSARASAATVASCWDEDNMPQFTVNAQRLDPYKNFKFRVKWDGKYVAGISKVSALKRSTEVIEHREGGDPSTSH